MTSMLATMQNLFAGTKDNEQTFSPLEELVLIVQNEEHEEAETVFNDIKSNNLRSLQLRLAQNPSLIFKRDSAGGTIFHAAYLYERYKICHWLVENFPREAIHPFSLKVILRSGLAIGEYEKGSKTQINFLNVATLIDADRLQQHTSSNSANSNWFKYPTPKLPEVTSGLRQWVQVPHEFMPYTGENVLHMVIIRRNLEETRWLLDFYKNHQYSVPGGLYALLNSNATGTMFDSRGHLYFGGYPLHFAVCCNDISIFDVVLSFSTALVKDTDSRRKQRQKNLLNSSNPVVAAVSEKDPLGSASKSMLRSRNILTQAFSASRETLSKILPVEQASEIDAETEKEIKYHIPPCDSEIFKCDHNGNNALHFCIIHRLQDMYTHVKKTVLRIIKRELKIAIANFRKAGCIGGKLILDTPFKGLPEEWTCYPPTQTSMVMTKDTEINDDWIENKAFIKLNERMLHVLNKDFHSPSTLAADYTMYSPSQFSNEFEAKKVAILKLLLEGDLLLRWKYGPVVANSIDIYGFDTSYDRRRYQQRPIPKSAEMHGVIEWLCMSDSEQGLEIPVVQQFISKKWKLVGLGIFYTRFYIHVLFTFFITVIAFHPFAQPFVRKDDYAPSLWVSSAYIVNTAISLHYIIEDLPTIFKYRVLGYFRDARGAAKLDRMLRALMISSFVITIICKIRTGLVTDLSVDADTDGDLIIRYQRISLVFVSFCAAVSWIYFFFFFLSFENVAPFLLIIYRILQNDFAYFFRFYSIIVISFGVATSVISNDGSNENSYGLYRCCLAMWVLLQNTVGVNNIAVDVIDLDSAYPDLKWLMDFYTTMFYVFVVLLLVNLLIGMIGNTYSVYAISQKGLVLMEQYNIICSMERSFTIAQKSEAMAKYTSNNPKETNDIFHNPQYQYQQLDESWVAASNHRDDENMDNPMIALLIIDAQVDFATGGSMAIPGTDIANQKVAKMIEVHRESINDIFVTLSSRRQYHISHPVYWKDAEGNRPATGTMISVEDLSERAYVPAVAKEEAWCQQYLVELEVNGKMPLTIWPEHCVLGSPGHCLVPCISKAIESWEGYRCKTAFNIMTGCNHRTETYSALEAEVEDPNDVSTTLNEDLLNMIKVYDKIFICGHSLSHNVQLTVRDLVKHLNKDSKIVLLLDACCFHPDYKDNVDDFIEDIKDEILVTTVDNATSLYLNQQEKISHKAKKSVANTTNVINNNRKVSVSTKFPPATRGLNVAPVPAANPPKSAPASNAQHRDEEKGFNPSSEAPSTTPSKIDSSQPGGGRSPVTEPTSVPAVARMMGSASKPEPANQDRTGSGSHHHANVTNNSLSSSIQLTHAGRAHHGQSPTSSLPPILVPARNRISEPAASAPYNAGNVSPAPMPDSFDIKIEE